MSLYDKKMPSLRDKFAGLDKKEVKPVESTEKVEVIEKVEEVKKGRRLNK